LCRFIDAEKATDAYPVGYAVAALCRVLGIPRSTYYAWLASRPTARALKQAEDDLAAEIREIHAGSRGAYGVPRIHAFLRRTGRRITGKRSSGSCESGTSAASHAAGAAI
jgi:hypothetical protein